MSSALRCDRCGAYYQFDISNQEDDGLVAIKTVAKTDYTIRRYDLCRTCRKELKEWLFLFEKREKRND